MKVLAIAGLVLSLIGVVILFLYGMPYRVERKGVSYIYSMDPDQTEFNLDRKYRRLGWLGPVAICAGTALQIAAVFWS